MKQQVGINDWNESSENKGRCPPQLGGSFRSSSYKSKGPPRFMQEWLISQHRNGHSRSALRYPQEIGARTPSRSILVSSPTAKMRVSAPPHRVRAVVPLGADSELIGNVDVALGVGLSRVVDLLDHVVIALPSRSTVWARDLASAAILFLGGCPHLEAFTMLRFHVSVRIGQC